MQHGEFVGRQRALLRLADALRDRRSAATGVLAWVEGEAGIGKTLLIRRFLDQAGDVRPAGTRGRAGSLALRMVGVDEADGEVTWAVTERLLSGAPGWSSAEAGADPYAVGVGMVDVFTRWSALGPLVVVVDDLHDADLPSATALAFAAGRLPSGTLLVVAARPDHVERLGERWRRLSRAGETLRVVLEGLEPDEVRQLAARMGVRLTVAGARRLWEHARGHPLHCRSLLAELEPAAIESAPGILPAPQAFAELVASRLETLGEPSRRFAEAGSVLGLRFSLANAAAMAGVPDAVAALEQSVDAGILEAAPGSSLGAASFVHPLVRAAVYSGIGLRQRAALHRAAATLGHGVVRLDHLVAAANGPDARLAGELAAAAGRFGVGHSARLMGLAARLSPDGRLRSARVLLAAEDHLTRGDLRAADELRDEIESMAASP